MRVLCGPESGILMRGTAHPWRPSGFPPCHPTLRGVRDAPRCTRTPACPCGAWESLGVRPSGGASRVSEGLAGPSWVSLGACAGCLPLSASLSHRVLLVLCCLPRALSVSFYLSVSFLCISEPPWYQLCLSSVKLLLLCVSRCPAAQSLEFVTGRHSLSLFISYPLDLNECYIKHTLSAYSIVLLHYIGLAQKKIV